VVEIRWRRVLAAVLALTGFALAGMGLVEAASTATDTGRAVGAACFVFFAAGAALLARRALDSRPVLLFTLDGVEDPTGYLKFGRIGWSGVRHVRTDAGVASVFGQLRIEIDRDAASPAKPSFGTRSVQYLTTGSRPTEVRMSWLLLARPENIRDRLRALAPDAVTID
jgi:hypothetical protein